MREGCVGLKFHRPADFHRYTPGVQIDWITAGMAYVVFLFSTTCHEAAHAWSAFRLGDDTAYRGGQVTLDPTPHVKREPFGMVVAPLLGFLLGGWMIGWASCPFDPRWAMTYPKRSALMAMAGPAANLSLVLLALIAMKIGVAAGFFTTPLNFTWNTVVDTTHGMYWPFIAKMLSLFFSMNLLLCVFNLIPLPPLDGAALPVLFLPENTARSYLAMRSGLGLIGLFIAWKLFGEVFPPVWKHAVLLFFGRG